MAIAFFAYIIFRYLFISKSIINLCTISLLYIMIGIYVGESTIQYSSGWVRLEDFSYLYMSQKILRYGFYSILAVFFFLQFLFKEYNLKRTEGHNLKNLFVSNVSWGLIIILSIPIYIVFFQIYFPVFESQTFISKYFQDRLEDFLPYRPYYTLSINALSTVLFLQINYFLTTYNRFSFFKLFLNKNFLKLIFIAATLFFTAKRGQFYFPIFISLVSYMIYKRHLIKLAISSTLLLVLIGISRNFSEVFKGEVSLERIFMALSTSFFVSSRELTRVLLYFNDGGHDFLYGKTYVAGLFSFIPTKINALKADYNYMRYTSIISNQNPDEFGGMRSTYLGEAYINFGYAGVILIPVLFGIIIYLLHLGTRKYSINNFIYYITVLWSLKILILPFYENGSSMFLFFFITVIFMIISALTIRMKNNKLIICITFLSKKNG